VKTIELVILRERSDRENPVLMRTGFLTSFGMTLKTDFSHSLITSELHSIYGLPIITSLSLRLGDRGRNVL
jgi:hypothetical protein